MSVPCSWSPCPSISRLLLLSVTILLAEISALWTSVTPQIVCQSQICSSSHKHCNLLSCQGKPVGKLTIVNPERRASAAATAATLTSHVQTSKRIKMPLKLQILELHQTAEAFQFKYISPKDVTQLQNKPTPSLLYQITLRAPTSPLPVGIWVFTVAKITVVK